MILSSDGQLAKWPQMGNDSLWWWPQVWRLCGMGEQSAIRVSEAITCAALAQRRRGGGARAEGISICSKTALRY